MKSERVRGGPGYYSEHDWKLLLSRIQVFSCLPCEQTVMGAKVEARMCYVTIQVRVAWTKVVRSRCSTYSEGKSVEQSTRHQLSVPEEDSKPFFPLHLGIGVAKENTA